MAAGWQQLSCHFRRPAPLTGHILRPALAAAGEVLAVGDQPLVQLAGEQGDAVHSSVLRNQWQLMHSWRLRLDSKASQSRQS